MGSPELKKMPTGEGELRWARCGNWAQSPTAGEGERLPAVGADLEFDRWFDALDLDLGHQRAQDISHDIFVGEGDLDLGVPMNIDAQGEGDGADRHAIIDQRLGVP